MKKVLFILKRREDFQASKHSQIGLSTGLYNSASFVNDMLLANNIESNLEVVIDNNDIDRVVTKYRPTHVIIEALWVVPTKFAELQKIHPNVTWVIRVHSEMPFMAGEGMAMDWLGDYSKFKNVVIAMNSPRMLREVKFFLQHINNWDDITSNNKIIYLPNFYPQEYKIKSFIKKDTIDISCFGAVRPLKDHLVQAFAAVEFADSLGKKLNFHVNAGRIEMQGDPMLSNLKGLFSHLYDNGHRMINHLWTPREEFLRLCSEMDIGMQVSFSETFNIVAADLISQGVPVVGSKEIPWLASQYCADPTDSSDMINKLQTVYDFPQINVKLNQYQLTEYTSKVSQIWDTYFI